MRDMQRLHLEKRCCLSKISGFYPYISSQLSQLCLLLCLCKQMAVGRWKAMSYLLKQCLYAHTDKWMVCVRVWAEGTAGGWLSHIDPPYLGCSVSHSGADSDGSLLKNTDFSPPCQHTTSFICNICLEPAAPTQTQHPGKLAPQHA